MNEINDSSSKYFESSGTITSTSTNRVFNLNSTRETLKAFENFDDTIEKTDFTDQKSTQFSSNIASKNAKETSRKRKSNKSSIWSRKISNATKIVTSINDAIDNGTKCLMYALNLTNSHDKS